MKVGVTNLLLLNVGVTNLKVEVTNLYTTVLFLNQKLLIVKGSQICDPTAKSDYNIMGDSRDIFE